MTQKLFKITQNGPKSSKTAQNDPKLNENDQNPAQI